MNELVAALRSGLAGRGDPAKAPAMQADMKSTLPFRGVPTTERRRLARDVVAEVGPPADRGVGADDEGAAGRRHVP